MDNAKKLIYKYSKFSNFIFNNNCEHIEQKPRYHFFFKNSHLVLLNPPNENIKQ